MKKAAPIILVLVLAGLLFVIKTCKQNGTSDPGNKETEKTKQETSSVNRDRGFDRRISYLEYSQHAKCRMECRHISKQEVEEVMKEGKINYNKSDLQNARCPRYAVESVTKDDQRVRIVFAQCNEKTEVVTVIDLETDWSCHCPGDDKKYENRN